MWPPAFLNPRARDWQPSQPRSARDLLEQVGPSMLRAIRRVLGPHHPDAEDVFQEAALALVGAMPRFRGDSSLVHFSCRVAVLTALSARRRLRTIPGASHNVAEQVDDLTLVASGNPETARATAGRQETILRLLEGLPAPQAEALALHVIEGLTLQEIAEACACPINTIKSRIRLAREALRKRAAHEINLLDDLREHA